MTLLHILIPARSPQVSCSHGVGVTYEFIKFSMISRVELGIHLPVNIVGASNESDAFQDNRLKNDNPISVPFPISYYVKIRYEGCDKKIVDPARWCIVAMGWQTDKFLCQACHLSSSLIPSSRWVPEFWCTQDRHTGEYRDFGVTNHGRHRRERHRWPWGGPLGGRTCSLGRRWHRNQRKVLAEAIPKHLRSLSGVSTVRMLGCWSST